MSIEISLHDGETPTFRLSTLPDKNLYWMTIHTRDCNITSFYTTPEEIDKLKLAVKEFIDAS